jgi:hypothetical protein
MMMHEKRGPRQNYVVADVGEALICQPLPDSQGVVERFWSWGGFQNDSKDNGRGNARRLGEIRGREADFSTALLTMKL